MKKILILILFVSACSRFETKQQKAEALIKKYLDSTLNDPHSYESVKFDTLKPFYATYALGDPNGKKMDEMAAGYMDSVAKYSPSSILNFNIDTKKPKPDVRLAKMYQFKEDSIEKIIKQRDITYKGRILDYTIIHTYRAKNNFGALGLHTYRFQIDSTLSKINYAEEINSN